MGLLNEWPGKKNSKVAKSANDTKVLKLVKSREGHMEHQSAEVIS